MANHRKYASEQDFKELKDRFFEFLDNDFKHVELDIAGLKGERLVTRILLGVMLTMMGTLIALVVASLI